MKKFALIAATLVMFTGCARNDSGDMSSEAGDPAATGTTTATGSAATSQTGTGATPDLTADQNEVERSGTIQSEYGVQPSGNVGSQQQSGSLQSQPPNMDTNAVGQTQSQRSQQGQNQGTAPGQQPQPPTP